MEVPLTSQHASVDSGWKAGWKCWQCFLNNLISAKRIKAWLSCILPHDSRIAFLTFYCHIRKNTIFSPSFLLLHVNGEKRQISSSPVNWSGRIIKVNWHASPVKFTDSPPLREDINYIFLSWLCVNALRCPKTNSLSHKPIHQKRGLNQVEWHLFRCNGAKLMRKKFSI